jgi:hypothetical protein
MIPGLLACRDDREPNLIVLGVHAHADGSLGKHHILSNAGSSGV